MKKILLINFRKNGDIFNSLKLVNSLEINNSNAKVSTLGYEEFRSAFNVLKTRGQAHFINRKKIETYFKNRIYSDALAINQFMNDITPVLEQEWDQVINFSNDQTGTLISSIIKSRNSKCEVIGLTKSTSGQVVYSDEWMRVLNDITTMNTSTPFNYLDCFYNALKIKSSSALDSIVTVADNNQIAFKNFQALRSNIGPDYKALVGIQINSSSVDKNIPLETINTLIQEMINDTCYFPVLLIAPIKEEQEMAESINKSFGGSLTIVESDFIAAPSVLVNLDAVITPDTSIKHLCDLLDLPVVEFASAHSPPFKMWTTNTSSVVIRTTRATDSYSKSELTSAILNSLAYIAGDIMAKDLVIGNAFSAYLPIKDKSGLHYKNCAGIKNEIEDSSRTFSRFFFLLRNNQESDTRVLKEIFDNVGRPIFNKWAQAEKERMTSAMRTLLSCIRNLAASRENPKSHKSLVESIDVFLEVSTWESLSAIPAVIFKSRFENLNQASPMACLEDALFSAKKDFQLLFDSISQCDDYFLTKSPSYLAKQGNTNELN